MIVFSSLSSIPAARTILLDGIAPTKKAWLLPCPKALAKIAVKQDKQVVVVLQNGLKGCRVAINFSNFSADDNGSGGVPIMGLTKMDKKPEESGDGSELTLKSRRG